MKNLFQAIRKSDIETVKALIKGDPALVNCVAKQPPKKMMDNPLYRLR